MDKHSVIIGAGGRLGMALHQACVLDHSVTALTRQDVDLSDRDAIRAVLQPLSFDTLWLTAALTDVDFCEDHPDQAKAVNTAATEQIADICVEKRAKVIFFSTDYVFDGEKESLYNEDDAAHALSVYGASKLQAEEALLAASDQNLAIRLSWLFGGNKPAFPSWVIAKAMQSEDVSVVEDRQASPTYTRDLITVMQPLIKGELDVSGIIHLCNQGVCTWQEWAQYCLDCAVENGIDLKIKKVKSCRMSDIQSFSAQRPHYSAMSSARYEKLSGLSMPSWKDAVCHHVRENLVPKLKN